MTALRSANSAPKKMAIITSYFKGETHGLLGPQMAAAIIEDGSGCECIVIAVSREDDHAVLKKVLADYFGAQRPIIGFSALSGREDLFSLAAGLRAEGAVTILAGPQASVDFIGEKDWQEHPHRFKGLWKAFSYALQGPAEQIIPLLNSPDTSDVSSIPGLLLAKEDGAVSQNAPKAWDPKYLGTVRWDNIYLPAKNGLTPLKIRTGQVLQHIGCPHAARTKEARIDYPATISAGQAKSIKLPLRGCSFCDVAVDKGFHGTLDRETVIRQIRCLPEIRDGRKIPFELINEYPLPILLDLLEALHSGDIELSQINLTLRADGLITGIEHLKSFLAVAARHGIFVLLGSVGFESFDDRILRNLNKGLSVAENLQAVRLMRDLKAEFGDTFGYSSREGAHHGFIHPTAWDTEETASENQKTISLYGLQNDILPPHSTPLVIHHASALGDWIREIEQQEGLRWPRYGSVIGWWDAPHADQDQG
ncbi:MAG: hypothetical protein JRE62_13045 [Deltaproteobacteria bacterium]|nr:hypothetical protein [Deltaproteobacteria bacterium]